MPIMEARIIRGGIACTLLGVLAWVGGCADSPSGPDPIDPPCSTVDLVCVSDPASASGQAAATGALAMTYGVASDVVYVSLRSGTAPGGFHAFVRRVGDTAAITVPVFDGGFDPVPITAQSGDSIEVVVLDTGGEPILTVRAAVRPRRPPIVVRTEPPPDKTDVPVNAAIVIVFSEPVLPQSLTASAVQLFEGSSPVVGTVTPLQGTATSAVFTPAAPLAANTAYRLDVTQQVRDVDGEALPANLTVDFTTGSTMLGTVASVRLSVDTLEVAVGTRFQVTASVFDAQGLAIPGLPVSWSSGNGAALAVSSTGLATALAAGVASVHAEVGGQGGGSGPIVVSPALSPVTGIRVSPESTWIARGGTLFIGVYQSDANGYLQVPRLVYWTSTNPAVATVTPTSTRGAQVSGVADGIARIIATTEGVSDTMAAVVVSVRPLEITPQTGRALVEGLARGYVGFRAVLLTVAGDTFPLVTQYSVSWSIDDPSVATVNFTSADTAYVQGVSPGTTTIRATTWPDQLSATASIATIGSTGPYTELSAGSNTCGVTADSRGWCWGGFVGNGTRLGSWLPAEVAGLSLTRIDASGNGACGLDATGQVHCWGSNDHGQLGIGRMEPFLVATWPVAVAGERSYTAISIGGQFACALATGGVAHCWGSNEQGQLGWGSAVGPEDCGSPCSTMPVSVSGGYTFDHVSSGGAHACGIIGAGVALCWGSNSAGQLGDGSITSRTAPVPVASGLTFVTLTSGEYHSCGLTSDGSAYCWGNNTHGELGIGTTQGPEFCLDSIPACSTAPVPVQTALRWSVITAGERHTCAIDLAGDAYCWGDNFHGQLGDGSTNAQTTPVPVAGGLRFTSLAAGSNHTCGLTVEGVAYCWGLNGPALGLGGSGAGPVVTVPTKVIGQP